MMADAAPALPYDMMDRGLAAAQPPTPHDVPSFEAACLVAGLWHQASADDATSILHYFPGMSYGVEFRG